MKHNFSSFSQSHVADDWRVERRQRHTPKTNAKWKERNIHSFIDSVLRLWIALTPPIPIYESTSARARRGVQFQFIRVLFSFASSCIIVIVTPEGEKTSANVYGVLKYRSFHFTSNINRLGSIKSEWHDATTWATSGECLGEKELNHLIYITLSFMCTTLCSLVVCRSFFGASSIYTFTQWARLYECFFSYFRVTILSKHTRWADNNRITIYTSWYHDDGIRLHMLSLLFAAFVFSLSCVSRSKASI